MIDPIYRSTELHLDGLVGPTHFYGGLGYGNLASAKSANSVSSPRRAALQGLAKMRAVHRLGVPQGLLPPRARPDEELLARCGFTGPNALADAGTSAPVILKAAWSTSSMWTANAATVTASSDAKDGRVHLTPANLSSSLHRSTEAAPTHDLLSLVFANDRFIVHDPLPGPLADEGAANHMRLSSPGEKEASPGGGPATTVFVHGPDQSDAARFQSRQRADASRAVSRLHGDRDPMFITQSQRAIDAGAFHNDVVAVSSDRVLFCHDQAFAAGDLARLRELRPDVTIVNVSEDILPLDDAIASYIFNSELITIEGQLHAIVEARVGASAASMAALDLLIEATDTTVHLFDLGQSMANGGGPACLRLRVPLTAEELDAVDSRFLVDEAKLDALEAWVTSSFRDELRAADLVDPEFAREVSDVDAALRDLLGLPD